MKRQILYSLLFKGLRFVLGGLFGMAVTMGWLTSGQAQYVVEAAATFLLWLLSAYVSAVMHHLKIMEGVKVNPEAPVTFADIRAAARAAAFDMVRDYVRKFKTKDESDESNQ